MKKEDVLMWCEQNNYLLISNKSNRVDFETVCKIAQEATGTKEDLKSESRKPELAFARHLAAAYLEKDYPVGVVAEKLGISHSMVSYARNLFNDYSFRHFKEWEKSAINHFENKINEVHKKLETWQKE